MSPSSEALRRVTVFASSTDGSDPRLLDLGRDVGARLAARGIGIVYGAGGRGLMGAVSTGALDAGGEVVGVIPRFMVEREWGRHDLTELHVVGSMHERKAMMTELCDAFLVLPGGIGTLEELFEVWTWRTLGLVPKPIALLDLGGFWQPLLDALRSLVAAGFVTQSTLDDLVVGDELDAVLAALEHRRERWERREPGGTRTART